MMMDSPDRSVEVGQTGSVPTRGSIGYFEEQRWLTIGISPTHRALIYRLGLRELRELQRNKGRLTWRFADSFHVPTIEELATESDVVWIECRAFLEGIKNPTDRAPFAPFRASFEIPKKLVILWCWNEQNRFGLHEASSCEYQGVVYNLSTLQSWIRRALQLGRWNARKAEWVDILDQHMN